jgi:hypothetical protein
MKDRSIHLFGPVEILWAFEDRVHDRVESARLRYYGIGFGGFFIGVVTLTRGL